MNKTILLIILSLFGTAASAQNDSATNDETTVKKSFLIILSTKNYDNALKVAKEAASQLNDSLNLRGMVADSLEGLTSNLICGCGELHGYIPRGRFDDGLYVSIEFSNAFEGFAQDYYMVIVASGNKKDVQKKQAEVISFYEDAYIRTTSVYMGCIH